MTDNNNAGRAVIKVDVETGKLSSTGYWVSGDAFTETSIHLTSGVEFRDTTIPFFQECLDLVREAHEWLPGVYSVGWDVVVGERGPILLEGNDDWSPNFSALLLDKFSERFKGMYANGKDERCV